MAYTVYGIFCKPENRMVYVGMTSNDPYVRLYQHTVPSGVLHELAEKYGFDALEPVNLETNIETKEDAFALEEKWTRYYDNINLLYNKGFGSNNTARINKEKLREQYDRTLRIWQQENGNWCKGKHLSLEHKEKISMACKGKIISEEAKRHMSEGSTVAKPVYCYNNHTKYSSGQKAAENLGLDPSAVIKTAKGKYKTTKGYVFAYPPVEPPWKIKLD